MDTDSFNRYSVIKMLCGIFSILIILSFIAFPKNRTDQIIAEPLLKDARPYKTEIISNLYKKYYPRLYTSRREKIYDRIILEAAKKHDIEAALIKAIIMAESSYNHRAVSKSGAVGLMQLMPATANALGVKDMFNPTHNINGGTKYIKYLLDKFNGNLEFALAAYNAGSRKVKKYNGIPPYKATRIYIKKVFEYYRHYQLAGQA